MKKLLYSLFAFGFLMSSNVDAQEYRIDVSFTDAGPDSLFLAYYFGNNQYLKDTAVLDDAGKYTFSGDETLNPGVYIVVIPPENEFFQILIDEGDQNFSIHTDSKDVAADIEIKGSAENERFYDYLAFIREKGAEAQGLREELNSSTGGAKESVKKKLEELNSEVARRQKSVINQNPDGMTALLIKSNLEIEIPEFAGTDEEKQMKQYQYYKAHYFDHIDLSDPRVVNTSFLHERIEYYMQKLTYQVPDSLIQSIDQILGAFDSDSDGFQFYLVHFLNEYAKSKVVGMDAVYVHLVDQYYAAGKAPWVEEGQLNKIIKNANTLRPILIGKPAPDLTLYKQDGSKINIHDVAAEYTVLFFWDPDCGHCKKSTPLMIDFYEKYKSKGVEIFGICTKTGEKESMCWDYIDEQGTDIWLNTSDKYLRSRYKQIYDVQTTPQIFVLDREKNIVFKRIGAEQLPQVLDHLMGAQEG